ncbi:MAG: hypothetical protein IJ622_06710 [Bacteroidales bacterium]|nr:hypothetical protein [Bacteroidales bacterium]
MQMIYNPKRKKLNKLKTSLVLLLLTLFAVTAKAQRNIWMSGERISITSGETINYYDSHGPAEFSDPNDDNTGMRVNYWDKWYNAPEQYTQTFVAPSSAPYVKVTFNKYTAYDWSNSGNYQAVPPVYPYNCQSIGD